MTWQTLYLPPDQTQWQGRADIPPASCFFQVMQMLNLLHSPDIKTIEPRFALIGFRCEEGIRRHFGRAGAAEGPKAIRHALGRLPVQKQNFVCFDAGDIICTDGDMEASQHALGEVIAILLEHHITPIALGGGHEIAWGHYQGINRIYPTEHLGIINFDAHFDMDLIPHGQKGNSCTPFLQIAEAHHATNRRFDYNCIGIQHTGNIRQLLETAKSWNTHVIWADELHEGQLQKCVDFIDRVVDENERIYASLCLDVFAAAFAPGVSAIQPSGLLPWHITPLIRQLAASGRMVSYDIAELSPRYDIDQCTAKLAANLIYEIIHHHHDHRSL